MAFKTAKLTGSTFAAAEDHTYVDAFVGAIAGPFKAFSTAAESDFISEKEAGLRQIGTGAIMGVLGEWFGHKRAAQGKGPILPMSV